MEENARKRSQPDLSTPVAKRSRNGVSTPRNKKGPYRGDGSSARRSGRLSAQRNAQLSPAGPTSPPLFQVEFQTPTPKKKTRRVVKGSRKKSNLHKIAEHVNRNMFSVEQNDYTFRVGDHAYVILDEEKLDKIDEGDEPCAKCMRSSPELGDMIECDKCLAGYHFDCLEPPIASVPECEWFCPVCELGGFHPQRDPVTYRELFLQNDEILTICNIKEIWREDNGDIVFSGPRYIRPEAAHCGRQPSHNAREIFRLDFSDEYEIERLIRPVKIHTRADFAVFENFADDDTFMVESEYSFTTKKFCKLKEPKHHDDGSTSQEDSDEYTPAQDTASQFGSKRGRSSVRNLLERQGGGESKVFETVRSLDLTDLSKALEEKPKYLELDSDAYGHAKLALTLTALPKCLSCRDAEKREIESFVNRFANSQKGSSTTNCLYICGVPGTGKTATVLETIRNCRVGKSGQKKPQFHFVELNCFRLPSPQHLYSHLLRGITDDWESPPNALQKLALLFTSPEHTMDTKRKPILVLVDEMDALISQNQKVLYNLSEWCSTKGSKLGIIGIANTLDLPERLHPRIKSRMGHHRMCFKPYNREQMIKIIEGRLEGILTVFNELSIKLAAAKVSGINGDVRRALELLRLAIDVYHDDQDESKGQQIMMHHVQTAFVRMFQTPVKQLVSNTSPLEKIILASCVLDVRRTGNTEAYSGEIVDRVHTLLRNAMMPEVKTGTVLAKIAGMGQRRLLICASREPRLWQKVALNCGHDDAIAAIHQEESLSWLHRVLCLDYSGL